jgi:predicted HAD superfamily Cof-like phosphohydrolase
MTDNDAGIEMNQEAARAFGNYVGETPAVPELNPYERGIIKRWSETLATMARTLKAEAAEANGLGHTAFGLLLIRLQLSVEETGEWAEALATGDIEKAAKELVDMSVVTDGHYLTLGLADLKIPLYREVHASNMTKLDPVTGQPIISEAGRWVKGPAYREADLSPILAGK